MNTECSNKEILSVHDLSHSGINGFFQHSSLQGECSRNLVALADGVFPFRGANALSHSFIDLCEHVGHHFLG